MMCSARRAALLVKLRGSWLEKSRVISATSVKLSSPVLGRDGTCNFEHLTFGGCGVANKFYYTLSAGERLFVGNFCYCSQAGPRREHGNGDVEAGFSKVARCPTMERVEDVELGGEELLSEPEFSDDDEDLEKIKTALDLLNSISRAPGYGLFDTLNKWADEGSKLSKKGILFILGGLRKCRMHWRALQFFEWLETSKQIELSEEYYALHIDCISNAQTLEEVEKFFDKIPVSYKGELAYRGLLRSCVHALNKTKAEAVFKKMKELDLPTTVEACNLMIVLYKRLDKKRIPDVLSIMEAKSLNPSLLTYKLLIDSKGSSRDIMGMEHVVEFMKADGIAPDTYTLSVIARHYISGGFKHKAETVLKKIEERKQLGISEARRLLLILYGSIGRDDKVGEIWRECELEPSSEEIVAAIEAWGNLGKTEEAEAIFDMIDQKQQLTSRVCSSLLKVYVDNDLLNKGKDLVERMRDNRFWINPLTLDSLVRLHIKAGEIEKAHEILHKASHWKDRPMFKTFLCVMEQHANCSDIHNTELLFQGIKACGYTERIKPFELLIQAYINAKTPAYGILDRMRALNVYPNPEFAEQLARVDPFQENSLPDTLD